MVTEGFNIDDNNIVLISEELQEWVDGTGRDILKEYIKKSDNNISLSSTDRFDISKDELTAEDVVAVFDKHSSVTYQVENVFKITDRYCLEEVNENSYLSNGYLRLLHLFYFIKDKDSDNKPFDVSLEYYFDGIHEGIIGALAIYIIKHFHNVRNLYVLDNRAKRIKEAVERYMRTGEI